MVSMASDTEHLWQEMHTGIRAFVGRRIRQAEDVDDVVQRVFLKVHEGLSSLRDEERVHAWVYRTATNAIADYYRGPIGRREVASGSLDDFAEGPAVRVADDEADDEQPAQKEFAGCIQPLLRLLSASDREALTLIDVEEVTQVDAAERLGVSVSGMKSRIQRARRRLRTVVEECCRVQLDRRGGVMAYERLGTCGCHTAGGDTPGADRQDATPRAGGCSSTDAPKPGTCGKN
jgi:RNA polymerase sigma-70 factor, ECF subfamily